MTDRRAFTLVELLIALAVSLILVAVVSTADGTLRTAARRVVVDLRFDRMAAVVEGSPSTCRSGSAVAGRVTVRFPSRGLLFTPDGLPRTCDGGGVGNATLLLDHRGRRAAVIVSSLGRVRWELR